LGPISPNILRAAFVQKSFCPKFTNLNCKHIKAAQKVLSERAARKILVKLTLGQQIFIAKKQLSHGKCLG
jgi:hypothetical protein